MLRKSYVGTVSDRPVQPVFRGEAMLPAKTCERRKTSLNPSPGTAGIKCQSNFENLGAAYLQTQIILRVIF